MHVDLNNFYASVECMLNPKLSGKDVAVCGASEDRHGIVLAKSKEAKLKGVKTGMTIWEAKKLAPNLIVLTANFPLYLKYSKIVRGIFENYTDLIEPFGIDESWLDVTASLNILGSPFEIATKIKNEIFEKTKLTVSIGISFNKIFAKLGSDIAKNDEIVEISKNNFKQIVWPRPVEELLYVGKATKRKLNKLNIFSIGDLANYDVEILNKKLGKWGNYIHDFANGKDLTPVRNMMQIAPIKSIGNSMTVYKDLRTPQEVKVVLTLLSGSIISRLRDLYVQTYNIIHIHITKSNLESLSFQKKVEESTLSTVKLTNQAYNLILENYNFFEPIRAIGISVSGLNFSFKQENIFQNKKLEKLELAASSIQKKYGNTKFKRAILLIDKKLSELDIKEEHIIHPESFFRGNTSH